MSADELAKYIMGTAPTLTVTPPDPTPLSLFLITGIPTAIVGFILCLFFFALAEAEMHHEELLAIQLGQRLPRGSNSGIEPVRSIYDDKY
jgi:hypothetical protein